MAARRRCSVVAVQFPDSGIYVLVQLCQCLSGTGTHTWADSHSDGSIH